jgi:predicted deacylase
MGKAVYPSMADISKRLDALARAHPRAVRVRSIGESFRGRDIPMAVVTDRSVPNEDKEVVLVIGGQHGSEEGGRISTLALLDWLLSNEAGESLRKQVVHVVPCVNVDGCERNSSVTAEGVNLNRCYVEGGKAATVEARAVWAVAGELQPEVAVDMHGLGGGGPQDMVLRMYTRDYTEDAHVHNLLAYQMVESAEAAGFPHITHSLAWPGWMGSGCSYCERCYSDFHALVFLTESNESIYTAEEMYRSGRGRIAPLIRAGNVRWPWERYPGYPSRISHGSFVLSLRAEGKTASARRAARLELWRRSGQFADLRRLAPERRGRVDFQCQFVGRRPLAEACGICTRIMGHPIIKEVTLDGRVLGGEACVAWQDLCSTFVDVVVEHLEPGEHQGTIRYEYTGERGRRRAGPSPLGS